MGSVVTDSNYIPIALAYEPTNRYPRGESYKGSGKGMTMKGKSSSGSGKWGYQYTISGKGGKQSRKGSAVRKCLRREASRVLLGLSRTHEI
eukprot:scaffold34605_cov151-Amphora_coffeaeformis.AAC.1